MPQSSPPVLIIRLDGIGDALALTPLLAALRAREIVADLVLGTNNAALFTPAAARHVEIAPFALRSSTPANLAMIRSFAARLAPHEYGAILVPTEDPGGYRLARAVGAPARIGFANGWGKPFKTLWARSLLTTTLYRPAGLGSRGRHECQVLFELGRSIVGDASPTRDPEMLRPLLLDHAFDRDERVAVQVTQRWERFGVAARALARFLQSLAGSARIRPISSAAESGFADAVEQASGVRVERYAFLQPWKESIAQARVLVAPDSGAIHVAGMLGTPAVALFPPQRRLDLQIARWHPWAAPYRIVTIESDWQERARVALDTL